MKGEGAGGLLGLTGLEGKIYLGLGPFVEGKTPTPACLVLIFPARCTDYKVAAQIGSGTRVAVSVLVYDCLSNCFPSDCVSVSVLPPGLI